MSKSAYLSPVSCENGYSAYIVNLPIYKLWRGGILSQSSSLQSIGNISEESRDKQEQSRPHQHTLDSKLFVVFPPKVLLHTCLTSLLWTEAKIQDYCNKRSLSSVSSYINIYNEHIIIRQVRDARCLIRMSVQWFPAYIVHYFNSYVMNVWLSNHLYFFKVNAYILMYPCIVTNPCLCYRIRHHPRILTQESVWSLTSRSYAILLQTGLVKNK